MHHARAVMHVGVANPRRRGKRYRHSRRMGNPQFYISGKRPIPRKVKVTLIYQTELSLSTSNVLSRVPLWCSQSSLSIIVRAILGSYFSETTIDVMAWMNNQIPFFSYGHNYLSMSYSWCRFNYFLSVKGTLNG